MLKSSKGVTLVALVITIILLLILAGVTVSIVMDNSMFDKAQTAVNEYNDASVAEKADIQLLQTQVNDLYAKYYASRST